MAISLVTADNFDEVVGASEIPVLVDFYADWCQPCKRIVPLLEEIAEEQAGQILVCKVDVDQSQDLARNFQVMSIPNVISFKGGERHKQAVGVVSKEELLELAV